MCCKDLFLLLWYFYCCISWSKCCLPMQDICLHLPWCTFLIAVDISSVDDGFIVGCWRLMFTCRYFSLYILNKRFLVCQFISISPAICILPNFRFAHDKVFSLQQWSHVHFVRLYSKFTYIKYFILMLCDIASSVTRHK